MSNDSVASDIPKAQAIPTGRSSIGRDSWPRTSCLDALKLSNADFHAQVDDINHPTHYNSSNAVCPGCERKIECIDITRHMNFNLGNAIKYLWRAEHKGGKEDLKKAIWYIQNEIDKK